MRSRIVIARIAGTLYVLVGAVNLIGLLNPEIQEQIISMEAVIFRYTGFVVVGVGLLLLQKWSAYVLAALLVINWIIFMTVYGGESGIYPWYVSLIGPVVLIFLFYFIWPILKPRAVAPDIEEDDASA